VPLLYRDSEGQTFLIISYRPDMNRRTKLAKVRRVKGAGVVRTEVHKQSGFTAMYACIQRGGPGGDQFLLICLHT
jgi:hypothetical protein